MDQNTPENNQANEAATEGAPLVKRNITFPFRAPPAVRNPDGSITQAKKRDSINLLIPFPTIHGIADIFNAGGKGLDKLVDLVGSAIQDHVRNVLTDNPTYTAANFPMDQATWEAFVAVPDAERKLRGIAKEVWAEFRKDYIAAVSKAAGKSVEVIEKGAKLMIDQRFSDVKTNKGVVAKLAEYLAIYSQTPNAENFSECVTFLYEKADTLLKADDSALLENL